MKKNGVFFGASLEQSCYETDEGVTNENVELIVYEKHVTSGHKEKRMKSPKLLMCLPLSYFFGHYV